MRAVHAEEIEEIASAFWSANSYATALRRNQNADSNARQYLICAYFSTHYADKMMTISSFPGR